MEERKWKHWFLEISSVSGLIAVVLTVTICVGYLLYGPNGIPPVLTHAFTAVIGFYFGVKSNALSG